MYKLLADQLQSPSALWVEPNTELSASRFFNQTSSISCSTPHLPMWMCLEVRFVDLAHWLRIKHRLLQLQNETNLWKEAPQKAVNLITGSPPLWRDQTRLHHISSPPPPILQLLSIQHQDTQRAGTSQLSQHYICTWEIKAPLTSGLAERKRGIYHMSWNSWCFRLRWAITPQCLTVGDQQPAARVSDQKLRRFTSDSTWSQVQSATLPSSGRNL